jgi:hypothetical protein
LPPFGHCSWERHFTVVMWDQRGEAKTFEKSGEAGSGSMTIDQMPSTALKWRNICGITSTRKTSFCSVILGARSHMIAWRPDLFAVYVGTGQVINPHRQFPEGLFFVHHGVGSQDWSADGFTRNS